MSFHFFVSPLLYHLYSVCSWIDYFNYQIKIVASNGKGELGIVNKGLGLKTIDENKSEIKHVFNVKTINKYKQFCLVTSLKR